MFVGQTRPPRRARTPCRRRTHAVRMALAALAAATLLRPALASDPDAAVVDVGHDGATSYAIAVDSVRRKGDVTGYDLTSFTRDGTLPAETRRILVDCRRLLRAVAPAQGASAPARLSASHVRAGSREGGELAAACALPEGPRSRMFAGFVVAGNGTVIVAHPRMADCPHPVAYVGGRRQAATVVATEGDLVILHVDGGPYPTLPPAARSVIADRQAATMLGVDGLQPRVSATVLRIAGSNPSDEGWPQVETLSHLAVADGPVWDSRGGVVGFGIYKSADNRRHAMVRLLPAQVIEEKLAAHGIHWGGGQAAQALEPEAAMRLAVDATLPFACERDR